MRTSIFARPIVPLLVLCSIPCSAWGQQDAVFPAKPAVIHKVQYPSERLEMTVLTSRILTLDRKISLAQVSNPDILEVTPLAPQQVQVAAKTIGVAQINLWTEDKQVFSIDAVVFGDARQLEIVLQTAFPNAALKVTPVANSVMISGFVDQPELINRIIRVAEEYYPKVINNMTVGGVQQVLLNVKIMEVSRTKLRRLGFDFSKVTGPNGVTSSPAAGLGNVIDSTPSDGTTPWAPIVTQGTGSTFAFGVVHGANAFLGVLNALRQDNLAKILAEPALMTTSGSTASFVAGGSFYIVPQGLAAPPPTAVEYGTKLDFVPIVLGNGRIYLEVRPTISQIDPSLTVEGIPGLLKREAKVTVELGAGQTLAIAGLVQSRIEAENTGLPWISEVPYLGVPFRRVYEKNNEVELLILVTPELVEAMDADEVPQCGPGMHTTSPKDWALFMRGHLEVPKCSPDGCAANSCPPCQGSTPPVNGTIEESIETVPVPQPAETGERPQQFGAAGRVMPQGTASRGEPAKPHNRYVSPKPHAAASAIPATPPREPPGLIGPVGYDVVK